MEDSSSRNLCLGKVWGIGTCTACTIRSKYEGRKHHDDIDEVCMKHSAWFLEDLEGSKSEDDSTHDIDDALGETERCTMQSSIVQGFSAVTL